MYRHNYFKLKVDWSIIMDNIKWLIDEYKEIKNIKKCSGCIEKFQMNKVENIEKAALNEQQNLEKVNDTTPENISLNETKNTKTELNSTNKIPAFSHANLDELCDCDDKQELMSIIEIINMDDQKQFEDAVKSNTQEDSLQIDLIKKQESENILHEKLLEKKQEFIELNKSKIKISQKPPCNCKKSKQIISNSNILPTLSDDIILRNIDAEKDTSKGYDDEIIEIGK